MAKDLKNVPCVILSGGKSSRMGFDKCFLDFKGLSLIEYQYLRLSQIFNECFISCKEDKFQHKFQKLILDQQVKQNDFSPMLALFSVLSFFKDTFVFIISVDMPNVDKDTIETLFKACEKYKDKKIFIAKDKVKTHYLCGFYHSSLASECLAYLKQDKHKISTLVQNLASLAVYFDEQDKFINLNFYEDYLKIHG